jgi:hypothetical protein
MKKQRLGFISNSSSSSFIIKVKNANKVCKHCHQALPSVIKEIEQSDNEDNEIIASGAEEVKNYILNYSEYLDEPEEGLLTELEKTDAPEEFFVVEISNHDLKIRESLYDSKNVEILTEI